MSMRISEQMSVQLHTHLLTDQHTEQLTNLQIGDQVGVQLHTDSPTNRCKSVCGVLKEWAMNFAVRACPRICGPINFDEVPRLRSMSSTPSQLGIRRCAHINRGTCCLPLCVK